ncbi:MAG: aldose 1-epimerase family protein, partial [Rhodanobacteraceae bacterium]
MDALNPRAGRPEQLGGALPIRYDDGPACGMRALLVRTRTGFEFECALDRALDIPRAYFRGTAIAWQAPAGLVQPALYAPAGNAFERSFFGGLVTTCGLTAFGPPGEDSFGRWGQHGRINHLAAESVTHEVVREDGRDILEIDGTVREAELFGATLELKRTWRIALDSSTLQLRDRVTNCGGKTTPHMLLYHCNAGYPLLDDGTRLWVSQSGVRARDAAAEAALGEWDRSGPPQADFKEQVFIHEPETVAGGRAVAIFENSSLDEGRGLALAIRYDPKPLPALFSWRMLGVRQYVMSVEPANCPTIEGRVAAGERGTLPFLEPGETRTYEVEFDVLSGREIEPLKRGQST